MRTWPKPPPPPPPAPAPRAEPPAVLATVSIGLVQELLDSIARISAPADCRRHLRTAGWDPDLALQPQTRVTHEQLVRLYQAAAVGSGDEMMGLWSRPIRTGALKVIGQSVIDAGRLGRALYRFCQVWNLLLDDHHLVLSDGEEGLGVELHARPAVVAPVNRFGHLLMLKLVHGIGSWLVGRELPVQAVDFAFPKPAFAADYPVLLPAPVRFDRPCTTIRFAAGIGELPIHRRRSDLRVFLERAPRDWIFTAQCEHAVQLRVREFLQASAHRQRTLDGAARHLNMSPRTLLRRLAAEGQSFQAIKDGLRRDLAIQAMRHTRQSLDQIADELGFSSVSVFHRAFRHWTGTTPGRYRRQSVAVDDTQPSP